MELSAGDLIVYKDRENKEYLGEYLGYMVKTEKKWTYIRTLDGKEAERFESNKEKADELFSLFKKQFQQEFPKSKPITARIDLHGSQIYFYFFAEDRYDFSSFVRSFREQVKLKFFIYQVSARDRIRMFPGIETRYDANGLPMMYSVFRHPLPQVSKSAINNQWLRGRDMERLKDRSGQLDHTLEFEADIYAAEVPKYPEKRSVISLHDKKMMCTGYNILTQEIKLRGEDSEKPGEFYGEFVTISLTEYESSGSVVTAPQRRKKKSWNTTWPKRKSGVSGSKNNWSIKKISKKVDLKGGSKTQHKDTPSTGTSKKFVKRDDRPPSQIHKTKSSRTPETQIKKDGIKKTWFVRRSR